MISRLDDPEPQVVVDRVSRQAPSGIKVVIVGAGFGGLLAALECWRKGHDVQVVEKSHSQSEAGDIIGLLPHALVTLGQYPTMSEEWDRVTYDAHLLVCFKDGELARPASEFEHQMEGVAKHALWPRHVNPIQSRRDIAFALNSQCERLGIEVTRGVTITEYSEDVKGGTAFAHASDGRIFTGDVVIAADGLGTKSHHVTIGQPLQAVSTGYCCDRLMYTLNDLKLPPNLEELIANLDRPQLRMYSAPKMHAVCLFSKNRICVALTHEDDGTASETWASNVSAEQMASVLPNTDEWDPDLVGAIRSAPAGSIIRWKLCWRNPQAKWTSEGGRIVQIGDAAHSFLPTSGNGAAMAMEDAISIAECLKLGGKDDIPGATKTHQLLRYQRTTLLQHSGFVNRRELNRDMNDVKHSRPLHFGKWVWTHNAENYATKNFQKARVHVDSGEPFENTNLPEGHKFEDWTMEEELEKERKGQFVQDLKTNGDWSIV